MIRPSRDDFRAIIEAARRAPGPAGRAAAVPLHLALLSDQLTPVLAYRRLVAADARHAPSFLLESVEGGDRQGRYSILGAQPALEFTATGHEVTIAVHRPSAVHAEPGRRRADDPLAELRRLSASVTLLRPPPAGRGPVDLPACVLAGWFGYAGYDTVRYAEPAKLASPPPDDRGLADLHFGFYDGLVIFDHVATLAYLVQLAHAGPDSDADEAYDRAAARLERRAEDIQRHSKPLPAGIVDPGPAATPPMKSNMSRAEHAAMVARALEYIRAGDIFQVVLGQRFERTSPADPFDAYRALRCVNPSPYMVYMQTPGCILVASSPEILCRVRREPAGFASSSSSSSSILSSPSRGSGVPSAPTLPPLSPAFVVTNRPLAGTRRRGSTPDEDAALERELLADPKERAEHVMLVDLGRNDVGVVARPGTVRLPRVMETERYSHVMHISSTVTGELRPGLDCWDALRAALPVGTISGAPKVRAMQIIDELEPVRRGPYGGGMGYVSLDGEMDIALTLRTLVAPTAMHRGGLWTYHLQAAGGIVAESNAADEYQETVNKAAAMARAIELAERAFAAAPSRDS